MARTAELPDLRLAKDKLRRLRIPKLLTRIRVTHNILRFCINIGVYNGKTNTGSCQLIKWKNDRKEVAADLLVFTALHVMLQPGCRSWKRQLLSPSPAHSNHRGHPKKPCECNSHVFMCDSKPMAQNQHAEEIQPVSAAMANSIHWRTSFFQTLACFPICRQKHRKNQSQNMEQIERSNSNEAQMHTTSANEQLHLAFAKTKFNWFHLLAKLNTYLPCPKAPGVF